MFFAAMLSRLRIPTVLALGLLLTGCGVNNIPTFEEQAKAKWADVNNQYQRRADLIPNLVETVQRLRRAGARDAGSGGERTREGDVDPGDARHRQRSRRSSSSSRMRRPSSPARSGRLIAVSENVIPT